MKTIALLVGVVLLAIVAALCCLDVEPCGVPSCYCGCNQKQPCRCAE